MEDYLWTLLTKGDLTSKLLGLIISPGIYLIHWICFILDYFFLPRYRFCWWNFTILCLVYRCFFSCCAAICDWVAEFLWLRKPKNIVVRAGNDYAGHDCIEFYYSTLGSANLKELTCIFDRWRFYYKSYVHRTTLKKLGLEHWCFWTQSNNAFAIKSCLSVTLTVPIF